MKKIIDEWTDRTDLTDQQKYYRRHPDKVKKRYQKSNKKNYAGLTPEEYEDKKAKERRRWSEMSPEKRAEKALKRSYGILYSDYYNLMVSCDFKCQGCLREVTTVSGLDRGVVDHCHTNKHIRGILCNHCNQALGLLKDKPETLRRLANYLESNG